MKKFIYTLVILAFAVSLNAQWGPDVRLTNASGNSWTSHNNAWCIAANGNVVHVVWHDYRDGNSEIYYKRSTDGGTTWGTDTRLTNIIGNSNNPSIAVSGSNLHAVWSDNRDGSSNYEIYYKRSTDGGINWETDTRLTNTTGISSNPSIAVSGTLLHLVWRDERDGNAEIYYKRSTDGGINWGTDTRLTNNTSFSEYPSITVSGSLVNVVWYDLRDGSSNYEIYYKRSTDAGITWGSDTRLTNNTAISYEPSIAVSGSNLHLVWSDNRDGNNEIYYKRSTDDGINWGADIRLTSESAISYEPSIAVSSSNLHLVWSDNRDGNYEIYYKSSTDGGITWGSDTRLTNNTAYSSSSSIAVSGTQVHVVWYDSRDGNDEIYYKRNSWITSAPVLISPVNNSVGQPLSLSLVWNKPEYSTKYRVLVSTDSLFSNVIINDSLLTDSVKSLTNLNLLTNYFWKVSAGSEAGWSSYSSTYKFKTIGSPTQVVLNLPTNNSVNQPVNITFKWFKATDQTFSIQDSEFRVQNDKKNSNLFISDYSPLTVSKYWMEYSLDSTFTNSVIRDSLLTDTLKIVNALNLGARYYWRVKALNQSGWGSFSDKWSFTTTYFIDSVSPGQNKINVPLTSNLKAYFRQSMSSASIDSNSVTFFGSMTGRKRGAITFNSGNNSMQLVPNNPFKYGEIVSTTLDSGIKTGTGIPIIPFVWSFTTTAKPSSMVFNKTDSVSVGTNPYSPVAGDFNGDGLIDIATSNETGQSVSILINNGKGNFVKLNPDIPTGGTRRLVTGDFDNDGDLDIAVGVANLSSVKILTNNGSGVFTVTSTITGLNSNHDLTTADFNGDGYLDLAISNWTANIITVLLNNTSGGFLLSSTFPTGNGVYCITSGDFDNDGFIDIAAPNYYNNNVSVYKNNGTGMFSLLSSASVGTNPQGIAAADIDGDGDLDLAVTNYSTNNFTVLKNNGAGTFTTSSTIGVGANPWGIIFADFDGDSDQDIGVLSGSGNSLFANNGTGTLTPVTSPSLSGSPYLCAADFNNDGLLDIVLAGYSSNTAKIYFNLAPPALTGPQNNSVGNLNSLNFVWNKALGASNYRFQIATDSLFNNLVLNDSTLLSTDSVKAVSGLSSLTWYYWRMNSISANGNSLWSDTWKFKTQGTPTQVTLIQPANNAVSQPVSIMFKWTRAFDQTNSIQNSEFRNQDGKKMIFGDSQLSISNYWFEYGTDSTFATVLGRDSTLTDTIKAMSGLNYITKYYWRVKALNQTGWGAFSAIWNFTTVPNTPNVPTLLTPANNSVDLTLTPALDWNDVSYAASYRVQVSTNISFSTIVYDTAGLTVSTIVVPSGNLTTNTLYYWRVNATNISGTSSYSTVWNFTTAPNVPNVPVLSLPANNATNQPTSITFKWFKAIETILDNKLIKNTIEEGPSPDVISKYWIEYGSDSTFATVTGRDSTLTDTTKAVTGLNTGTSYYWRVKAKNQTGWGGFSTKFKFTTLVPTLSLNLKVYLEGFWGGTTQVTDTLMVYLASSTTPYAYVDTAKVVLSATGQASMNFNRVTTGSYYIVVNHRNHLETWSKLPQSFVGGTPLSYDFTTAATQAYGDNMKQVGSVWVLIGGDANRDGSIDAGDIGIFVVEFGMLGYLRSDFNGDEDVNAADVSIIANNFGLIKITPGVEPLSPEVLRNKKMQIDKAVKNSTEKKRNNNN